MWPDVWVWVVGALLVFLITALVGSRARVRGVKPDIEVTVILTLAAFFRTSSTLSGVHVVRASLCNDHMAAAVGRAGYDRLSFEAKLRELGCGDLVPWVATGELSFDNQLKMATARAATAALGRGETEYHVGDLMSALASGALRELLAGLELDDSILTSVVDSGPHSDKYAYVWNDAVSPMQSVVAVLERIFMLRGADAVYRMLTIHLRGYGALGPFREEEARRLIDEANSHAAELAIPLVIRADPPDTTGWRMSEQHGLLP